MAIRCLLSRAELGLLAVMLIWGLNFPIMKLALADVHPFTFNALRLTLSTGLLGALHLGELRRGVRPSGRIGVAFWLQVAGVGFLGYFVYQVLFLYGLAHTTASNSSLLVASSPIWAALSAWWWMGERLKAAGWLGVGTAFLDTALIASAHGGLDWSGATFWGNLLTVCSAIAWGVFTTCSRPVASVLSPVGLAFWTSAVTLPLHWVLAAGHLETLPAQGPLFWGAVLYSGAMSTGLAYVLYNLGIRQLGSSQTAAWLNLVPVLALLSSHFVLDEPLGPIQVAGGALVLAGLATVRQGRVSAASRSPDPDPAA